MTIHRTRLGTNEDGSPQYHIYSDDPTKAIVLTGPYIEGDVSLPDGTTVDVTPLFIEVEPEQALAVSDAIGKRFEEEGHPLLDAATPFVHTPSDLTHGPDGQPAPAFAEAVESAVPPTGDSSPTGVMASLGHTEADAAAPSPSQEG